jgi:hypothetical protein
MNSPNPDSQVPRMTAPVESSTTGVLSLERNFEITVNGLIGAYDLSPNAALQTHIAQVLARVGVARIEVPSGTVFDPSVCEAISTMKTDDQHLHRRVSETLRPGWRRPDEVLRSPQVSVWIAEPEAPTAPMATRAKGFD